MAPSIGGTGPLWRVRFANIDNVLQLEIRRRSGPPGVLRASYEANTPLERTPDPTATHRRPRACLAVEGARLRVERLRLLRDVHYTDAGQWGTRAPLQLGPDELFVLGDSSPFSEDSRMWGAVPLGRVVGRPVAVVWPPGRWRWLE